MMLDRNLLIDQTTGEFDWTYIKRQAVVRAQGNYGSSEPPVSWVRDEIRALQDWAGIMRRRWRQTNGLPDDTEYVTVTHYGRSEEGVQRSRF